MSTINSEPALKVSVVVPAYNVGPYIARAVNSVLDQNRPADEIVVVDDGSTDDTAEIVRSYGHKVRLIHQANAGASAARNAGILAARHPWIAFLDGDDEWLAQNLELQMGLLQRNPELNWATANFLRCLCRTKDRFQNLRNGAVERAQTLMGDKEYFQSYFEACTALLLGHTNTMIVKKQALIDAGLFRTNQTRHNDEDMWFKLAYRHRQIGCNLEPLAIYHMDVPNSITKAYDGPKYLQQFLSHHLELSKQHNCQNEFKRCAVHMLRYWIHKYLSNNNIVHIRELIVQFDKILPSSYKSAMRLLTIYPHTTYACMPVLSRINRYLRLPL